MDDTCLFTIIAVSSAVMAEQLTSIYHDSSVTCAIT